MKIYNILANIRFQNTDDNTVIPSFYSLMYNFILHIQLFYYIKPAAVISMDISELNCDVIIYMIS